MNQYFENNTGLKVGALVRFKDISSGSRFGNGSFTALNGTVGVLVSFSECLAGNPMATFLAGSRKETFNVHYFEAINDR